MDKWSVALVRRFWETIPVSSAKISRTLAAVFFDGAYLTRWKRVAAWLPIGCTMLGLVLGGTHFLSRGETFTFSILLMCLLLAISCFGAALGFWLTVGYAIGDFLFFRHTLAGDGVLISAPLAAFGRIGLPALLLYFLLFQLLSFVPVVSKALSSDVLGRLTKLTLHRSVHPWVAGLVYALVHGLMTMLLVYVWAHVVPTLIRPVWTWIGYAPPVQAMEPLQTRGELLVKVGFYFGFARSILEQIAVQTPSTFVRLSMLYARQRRVERSRKMIGRVLGVAIQAVLMTFLLSGLLLTWTEAVIVLASFAVLILVREKIGTIKNPLLKSIRGLPLVVRFVICAWICTSLAEVVVGQMWNTDPGFRSVWISVLLSMLVFSLFIPGGSPHEAAS